MCSGLFRSSFSRIPDIRNSAEHTSELNHSRARLMCSGIPEGRTLDMVFCATCIEHSVRRTKKQVSTMVFCCQQLLLPRTAASSYYCRHCCHCLSRGSSGRAGMAACAGGSGGSSGAILFLVVVVILLLFACPLLVGIVLPLFIARCSFRRPPLARFQRTLVG